MKYHVVLDCIINYHILIKIPMKVEPTDPIIHKSSLVQAMAWHQTNAKPLPLTDDDPVLWLK